jgi:hypothetical protein
MTYLVFETYYKHGETCVSQFDTGEAAWDYLMEFLEDNMTREDYKEHAVDRRNLAAVPLRRVIEVALALKSKLIAGQTGWAVVNVVEIQGTVTVHQ